jgi:S-adenosylmethionine decarboxylase
MSYIQGTHILASLSCSDAQLLNSFEPIKQFLASKINEHNLNNLGEVYHNFSPKGFTALVCLSESHVSIHTWPEYNLFNVDIYLSNVTKNNDDTCRQLFNAIQLFFNASIISYQEVKR